MFSVYLTNTHYVCTRQTNTDEGRAKYPNLTNVTGKKSRTSQHAARGAGTRRHNTNTPSIYIVVSTSERTQQGEMVMQYVEAVSVTRDDVRAVLALNCAFF